MYMYMQFMYMVQTKSVQSHTGFNQLSQQVFVANTEMQYWMISLIPPLQGRMRMRAVPVQKMVIFMQGQTLLKQRRPSASLSVAWSARSNLVLKVCILCYARCLSLTPQLAAANSHGSTGCLCLDINLLKPTWIEFAEQPALSLSLPDGPNSPPKWLEYIYRTAHPFRQQTWQSGLARTCRMSWNLSTKLIRGQSLAVAGPLQIWIIICRLMLMVSWVLLGFVEWDS